MFTFSIIANLSKECFDFHNTKFKNLFKSLVKFIFATKLKFNFHENTNS